jgi:hypothetical protein
MYFPAGIPMLALVALVVWNTRLEMQRARANGQTPPKV